MQYSSLLLDGCFSKILQRPLNRRCHPLWQRRPLVVVARKLEATIFKYKFILFPTRLPNARLQSASFKPPGRHSAAPKRLRPRHHMLPGRHLGRRFREATSANLSALAQAGSGRCTLRRRVLDASSGGRRICVRPFRPSDPWTSGRPQLRLRQTSRRRPRPRSRDRRCGTGRR